MQHIALDAHERYTPVSVEHGSSGIVREARVPYTRGAIREFLGTCEPGSPVALETVGNWYWIVDEIEAAGMVPRRQCEKGQAHARCGK